MKADFDGNALLILPETQEEKDLLYKAFNAIEVCTACKQQINVPVIIDAKIAK